ncbi:hypothetical protein BASA81_011122 [Batrachochytrium salamandrivorans]|nr:hypothetical protein BASA81_011122 [Batrachochytrium salamandrivorans]
MEFKRSRTTAAAAAAEPSIGHTVSLLSSSEDEDEDVIIVNSRSPRAPDLPAPAPPAPPTDVKEHIKCNICFEVFHDPVLLVPCAHMYCGGCFSGWVNTQDFHKRGLTKCPACRHDVSMVLSAPKNLTCIVDDYLKQNPTERRTRHDLLTLSKQDTVPRNSSLACFQQQQQQPFSYNPGYYPAPVQPLIARVQFSALHPSITSANVQVFAQIFGLPHSEARRLLTNYQRQGYSNDQAVEHYMTTITRG